LLIFKAVQVNEVLNYSRKFKVFVGKKDEEGLVNKVYYLCAKPIATITGSCVTNLYILNSIEPPATVIEERSTA
jgi:hypothetical protein